MCLRLAATALLLALGPVPAQNDPAARRPNVLFVMADDLGYRELGSFGQQKIRTPRLDRLARQGMRLTRHYSGSPVCAPSRCVLMTGMHPGHAAVRANKEHQPEGQWPLPSSETTLATLMQAAGYRTGGYGKWGLGPIGSSGDPLQRGFDHFFGYNCQRHAHWYWPSYLWDDDVRIELANVPPVPGHARLQEDEDPNDPKNYSRFVGSDYAPDRILTAAKGFLRDNQERPFFLYYPSVIPHLALHVPDAETAAYAGEFEEILYPGGKAYTPHHTPRAAYAAMITRLDRSVGELLDLLDEFGLADDTIVVFTSDNGATHSPIGGTDVDFFESCGELRGRKGSLHEGGIRVPAIVRWPGHVPAGGESDRVTGFEDWMPTLAELCGFQAREDTDGISFAATLRGESQPARDFLYREFAGYGGWQAVWVGDEKLVRQRLNPRPKKPKKPKMQAGQPPPEPPPEEPPEPVVTELYDLASDPSEARDLAAERPERVAELAAILAREHVASPVFRLKRLDGEEPQPQNKR